MEYARAARAGGRGGARRPRGARAPPGLVPDRAALHARATTRCSRPRTAATARSWPCTCSAAMAYEPAFREVEAALSELGGRPHWGKRSFLSAAELAPRYPRWDDFQAVRARARPATGASPTPGCGTCWDDAMKTFNIFDGDLRVRPRGPGRLPRRHGSLRPEDRRVADRRLGLRAPAGQSLCPYHYESDEEWVLVLAGPADASAIPGARTCSARGRDVLPGRPEGAHKTTNDGTETVRLVMLSTKDEPACAIYPDSNKIGIWTGRRDEHVLVRLGENLDYYDGEALEEGLAFAAVGRARCRRPRRRAIRCTTSKRSHSSPAFACRNQTRSPTAQRGGGPAGERRLDLARALARVEPAGPRAGTAAAAGRAPPGRRPGSRRPARSRAATTACARPAARTARPGAA